MGILKRLWQHAPTSHSNPNESALSCSSGRELHARSAQRRNGDDPLAGTLINLFFDALMHNMPDAIYLKDIESRFVLVNNSMARKFDLAPAAFVGKSDFDIFTKEHARKTFDDEQHIIKSGEPILEIEEKETWPDGRETWVQTSKMPLKDSEGTIIGTFGFSRDITEKKRSQEELRKSTEQLRQAQKMEAFGQLAGGIAHDFNNTLSVILGTAQLLDKAYGCRDSCLRDNLSIIVETAKRSGELTSQLMAFSRKTEVKMAPISLHEVIHSVVTLLERTLGKGIQIIERLYVADATIMGDYAQLQNALLNLSINSRDAMPNGGTLTFATEIAGPGSPDQDKHTASRFLKLLVSDTGIGMDTPTLQRAFEPFFTTKPLGKGTGLGLASVYGTLQNHHGIIEVTSKPGKGTTFSLFFPLIESKPAQADTERKEYRGSGRVLIIDDEEQVREIVVRMLHQIGFQATEFSNGRQAVEYFRQHHQEIDITIADMTMPGGMNGYECVLALKEVQPNARIIIATGYNLASDTQVVLAKGISGFLQKPYSMTELSQVLAHVMKE